MASVEQAQRSPFMSNPGAGQTNGRTVPILATPIILTSSASPRDAMDITPPSSATMAPPARRSPDADANAIHDPMADDQPSSGSLAGPNAAAAAAAAANQPKVVQTAFIHKLYKYAAGRALAWTVLADAVTACSKTRAFSI